MVIHLTSGIRHALTENDKVDFHDAKFMLVVCSAFVNFVKAEIPGRLPGQ